MDRYLRAYFDKGLKPNRAQHLVVSDSKHLFFYEKDEVIRYQKKDLDQRTCGTRQMVTRVIAIDEDTGVLYGELWPREDQLDLVGFLARAWARKDSHPMRGFPSIIYAPSRVLEDKRLSEEALWCASIGGSEVRPALGGFGPATVAAREYERRLQCAGAGDGEFVLRAAHLAAQHISYLACANAASAFAKQWADVAGPPMDALQRFDGAYDERGAWRMDDFERGIVTDGT
jgi:hypothetical protein